MGKADPDGEGGGLEIRGCCLLQHPLPLLDISHFAVLVSGVQARVVPCLSFGEEDVGSLDNFQCGQGWVLARSALGYGRCRSGWELLGWCL